MKVGLHLGWTRPRRSSASISFLEEEMCDRTDGSIMFSRWKQISEECLFHNMWSFSIEHDRDQNRGADEKEKHILRSTNCASSVRNFSNSFFKISSLRSSLLGDFLMFELNSSLFVCFFWRFVLSKFGYRNDSGLFLQQRRPSYAPAERTYIPSRSRSFYMNKVKNTLRKHGST